MLPDILTLLRLCSAGAVFSLLLWAFARHPRVGVVLLLCPGIVDATMRQNAPAIDLGGVSFQVADVVAACALTVAAGRLAARRLHLGPGTAGAVGLLALVLVSLSRGAVDLGLEPAVNESRHYVWFLAAALYVVTTDFGTASVGFAAKTWAALACSYALISVSRWSTTGFTSAGEYVMESGKQVAGRPVTAAAALVIAQSALLLITMRRPGRHHPVLAGGLLLVMVLLQHRTVWILTVIAVAAYLVLGRRVGRERLPVAAAAAFTGIVAYIGLSVLPLGVVGQDLESSYTTMQGSQSTLAWRVTGWEGLLSERSGVVGTVFGRAFGSGFERLSDGNTVTVSPHNWYVETFLRIGVVGLVLLIGVYVLAFLALRSGSHEDLLCRLVLLTQLVFFITYSPSMEQGVAFGLVLWHVRRTLAARERDDRQGRGPSLVASSPQPRLPDRTASSAAVIRSNGTTPAPSSAGNAGT